MEIDYELARITRRAVREEHRGNYDGAMRLRNEAYRVTFEKIQTIEEEIKRVQGEIAKRTDDERIKEKDFWDEGIKFLKDKRAALYGDLRTFEELFYESGEKLLAECD